ncbi:MAG: hypothetical protein JXA98_02800 [Methanosarcinaceae archaeon]|nr:hypothetical protein [Methanosarcinaceae archaeon]
MSKELETTAPKPFIFVLMPFDAQFNDTYKFGIKGAAEDVGAYAERIDEQIFSEGILERIFNQISKADVIVADMTGRNPNVFYEVGYAHALGKVVLLLTQNVDDIPFDLKHRPHIVYAGKIETLREKLTERLIWAIKETSRKGKQNLLERFLISLSGVEIPLANSSDKIPILEQVKLHRMQDNFYLSLKFSIRNRSPETVTISHVYLITPTEYEAVNLFTIEPIVMDYIDSLDGLSKQCRLRAKQFHLAPEAVDLIEAKIGPLREREFEELFKLRIHTLNDFYDYPFKIHQMPRI